MNFKVRGPSASCNLHVLPTVTFSDFVELLLANLSLAPDTPIDILNGFPPAVINVSESTEIGSFLTNNDTIRVQLKSVAGQQAQGKTPPKKAASTMKATKKSVESTKKSGLGFGARVATLHEPSNASGRKRTKSTASSIGGSGSATGGIAQKRRRQSSRKGDSVSSESDIAEVLIRAANGSINPGDKIFRKVFRGAVANSYEETKAFDRLNAVFASKYTITKSEDAHYLGDHSTTEHCAQIVVSFTKGVGSRGSSHEDVCTLLPEEMLPMLLRVAVREGTDGREALKPANLALRSPRIYWSLVFHHGKDVIATIKYLLAGAMEDFSWLDDRRKHLSEKARENQAQEMAAAAVRESKKRQKAEKQQEQEQLLVECAGGGDVSVSSNNSNAADSEVELISSSSSSSSSHPTQSNALERLLYHVIDNECAVNSIVPIEWHELIYEHLSTSAVPQKWDAPMRRYLTSVDHLTVTMVASVYDCDLFPQTFRSGRRENATTTTTTTSSSKTQEKPPFLIDTTCTTPAAPIVLVSVEEMEDWMNTATWTASKAIWRLVCGGGSQRLRRALIKAASIRKAQDLRLWRNAVQTLYEILGNIDTGVYTGPFQWPNQEDSFLSPTHASSHTSSSSSSSSRCWAAPAELSKTESGPLTVQRLSWMCQVCQTCEDVLEFDVDPLLELDDDNEDENDGEEEDDDRCKEQEQQEEEDGEWLYGEASHPYMGRRARIVVGEDDGFWADGSVVAYAPATPDGDPALWKVKLDSATPSASASASNGTSTNSLTAAATIHTTTAATTAASALPSPSLPHQQCKKFSRTDELEDMEEHELLEAFARWDNLQKW